MSVELLTNSRLKTARACMRRHHNEYELGYRAIDDGEEVRFGSLIHSGLEAWWKAAQRGESGEPRLLAALEAMREVKGVDAFVLAQAEAMMAGYEERWGAEALTVLSVEVQFDGPLINPETGAESRTYRMGGKIDVVVRDGQGRVLNVEHKTSGEDITPGSFYWQHLRLDSQISAYVDGAANIGHQVEGTLYDVLGKPGLRPKKATPPESRKYKKDGTLYENQRLLDETPDEFKERLIEAIALEPARYFARGTIVRLETEMQEARADVWALGRIIRENQLAGRAPRNTDACFRFNRPCPFFAVCSGAASLDDTTKFEKVSSVHPELQQVNDSTPGAISKEEIAA